MTKYIFIFIFVIISSCTSGKVVNSHGNNLINITNSKLIVNKTNKNDIIDLLGPPSSKSSFNENIWIYIETKKQSTSLFKIGSRKLIKSNVLVVRLNERGVLKKKDYYNIDDMNKIKFSEQVTKSGYDKNSYVYGVLRSLRDKINSPIKRKSSKDN
tara:strand:- start:73 stop:540 length:468 start_codon:yes stop_codon:yes gene_type:complete